MRRLVLSLGSVALLAGCGIQPTPPVGIGDAPRGVAEGPTLYFYKAGQLVPVVRRTGKLGEFPVALQELFKGIQPGDDRGLYSELPKRPYSTLTARVSGKNEVEVRVLDGGREETFEDTALRQIVCTMVARNMADPGVWSPGTVRVNGTVLDGNKANCGSRRGTTTPA
ncbi:hypothetical protein JOF53_004792 [Crossiella equi]|uniref:GerMN domain-containing protein n=1 Tax=Crossiella equi TaxID=130796 RepID=A0ABS5AH69_9PSEU|nr:hypothetical protein [Crossiella equi]MBP2475920.1 hypothetical protein [Crossiella equi]